MIRNRTAQLIFQTGYCTLGFVGCVASLGPACPGSQARTGRLQTYSVRSDRFDCQTCLTYLAFVVKEILGSMTDIRTSPRIMEVTVRIA